MKLPPGRKPELRLWCEAHMHRGRLKPEMRPAFSPMDNEDMLTKDAEETEFQPQDF
jgi:hypothetical protein